MMYPHLSEAVYQRALQLELQAAGHTVLAEVVKPVMYKGMHVGTVRADLVVHNRQADDFVLELKRVPQDPAKATLTSSAPTWRSWRTSRWIGPANPASCAARSLIFLVARAGGDPL